MNDPRLSKDEAGLHKPEADWNEADHKLVSLNAKAMNVLYCALDANEFNHVSGC